MVRRAAKRYPFGKRPLGGIARGRGMEREPDRNQGRELLHVDGMLCDLLSNLCDVAIEPDVARAK
jgi:hypothetical protein